MYGFKQKKEMRLMNYPGRIPLIPCILQLWLYLREYCTPDEWEMTEIEAEEPEMVTWGHYDDEQDEWVYL